ncbi:hypothetical protein [Methylotuvimicrobium buryatense]|uniref:hypothetical protein n=1 Tax=Methylotuvimicrobium buryatense TaxID=95641 RepID=UPI001586C593|nr:hypothetical protein [Methylotuvimicrobium buryatense]
MSNANQNLTLFVMIVFSNTTPVITLSSIQSLKILPKSFGEIHLVLEVITCKH